jgi:hypothetical protein
MSGHLLLRATSVLGTNRTNHACLTMSVDRGQPEAAFRDRQDRFGPKADSHYWVRCRTDWAEMSATSLKSCDT